MTSATNAAAGLTIDALAARVGLTVRTVRAYAGRGLLPPPTLRGRTGWYGDEHLARLTLIKEMLTDGYTLAAVERVLSHAPSGVAPQALAMHKALLTPWLPEEPELVDRAALAARAGIEIDDALVELLASLGVVTRLTADQLRVESPTLLRVGLQVVALGIPPEMVIAAQQRVTAHAQAAAKVYVDMFRDTVWRAFADAGQPPAEWDRVQQAVERVQPVASQAMLAAFRQAMAEAIDAALGEELS